MTKLLALAVFLLPVLAFAQNSAALDNPLVFVKVLFEAITSGRWPEAGAALLVLAVALLRIYGRKLHDALPDHVIADKALAFLFDTKPGGWCLNALTGVAGALGTALVVGSPITWALVKPILTVSLTAAGLWELIRDLMEWWKAPSKAAEAGAAAAEKPPANGLGR